MRIRSWAVLAVLTACEVEGEGPPSQPFHDGGYVIEGDLPADVDLEEILAEMNPSSFAIVGDPLTGEVATIQSTATPLARVANADFTVVTPAACTNCGGGCPPTSRTLRTTLRHTSGMGGESFTVTPYSARNFTNVVTTPGAFVLPIGSDVTLDSTGSVTDCTRSFSYIFDVRAEPRVFVTSTSYNGNLGGVAGADAKCQDRANAAALGGTWKAWIADPTVGLPSSRFTGDGPWFKVNSATKVADTLGDLTDGYIHSLINNTEFGAVVVPSNRVVWTGIVAPNSVAAENCTNWTSNLAARTGRRGSTARTNFQWVDAGPIMCSTTSRALYCFEQ